MAAKLRPLAAFVAAVLLAAACAPDAAPGRLSSPGGDPELWRRDRTEPYPFTTPVPPRSPTPVDGVYTRRLTAAQGAREPLPCARCAPYRRDQGLAVLVLQHGRFTVDHPASEFRSAGHFVVEGDRITIFNDPNCPRARGVYRWHLDGGALELEVVEDPCAFDLLRARYLSAAPWRLDG